MKKYIVVLFVLLLAAGMAKADQYLQASSTITQCPGTAPEVVKIDVTDAASALPWQTIKLPLVKPGRI